MHSGNLTVLVPNGSELVEFMKSQLQQHGKSERFSIEPGKLPVVVERLNFFIADCEKTYLFIKNAKGGEKGMRGKRFSHLKNTVAPVVSFSRSLDISSKKKNPSENELVSAIKKISKLASKLKGKERAEKFSISRGSRSRSSYSSNSREVKSKAHSLFKLYRKTQELKVSCETQKEQCEKTLNALKANSHTFLEIIAKISFLKIDQAQEEAEALCANFLSDLATSCSQDDQLVAKAVKLRGKLFSKDGENTPPKDNKALNTICQKSLVLYFKYSEELKKRLEELKAIIRKCENDIERICLEVPQGSALTIVSALLNKGKKLKSGELNFFDPQGKHRVTLIIQEPTTSFVEKAEMIARMLIADSVLNEECTEDEFRRLVVHWPRSVNISGIETQSESSGLRKLYKSIPNVPNQRYVNLAYEYLLDFL